MPQGRISANLNSPTVGVFVDMGHPLLNRAVDGFFKIGTVGASRVAAEEIYSALDKGRVTKHELEHTLKKMGKEGLQCGAVAGVYTGLEYGVERVRGRRDWVAETRFASHTIVLRRLVRVKEALCQMVISNKWGGWKQVDTEKAKIVKDLIFSNDFWNRVEYALELTEPLMSMLRYADTDEPCLGNIYDAMDSMLEKMKSKNALISGALTGAVVSLADNGNRDKMVRNAITGGAIATASEFIRYLT